MESQTFLPIQYHTVSKPEISRGLENKPDTSVNTSFQISLNESIIDVYERSNVNVAVPDERKGVDRRVHSNRRHSSPESVPLQSGKTVADVDTYSAKQKTNQAYNTEKTMPAFFSPSLEKGSLLDIWV
jgi:hypothetical protein